MESKLNRKIILASIITLIILLVAKTGIIGSENSFDIKIMEYIHTRVTLEGFKIMKVVTQLGSHIFIIGLLLIISSYLLYKRDYPKLVFLLGSSVLASSSNQIIKYIFKRPRPEMYALVNQAGYSFPSGHSMGSIAFYASIFFLLYQKRPSYKNLFMALNFLIVFLIGLSRLYLGVHWPTDVLSGFIMGYTSYLIFKKIYLLILDRKKERE